MLRGVLAPVPTPFVDDELDVSRLADVIDGLASTRLGGLLVLGTNGEQALVEPDEADLIVRTARHHFDDGRPLLAGTGRDSTRATIEACRRAAEHGATHALVRPPAVYSRFLTQELLFAHYGRVADASPIPVVLYNQPAVFGVEIAATTAAGLSRHENIVGLKDSSGNISHVSDVLTRAPEGFDVVTGVATMMYVSLLSGARGSIVAVANVVPTLAVQLYEHVLAGELHKALALQRALAPLARAVTTDHGVAGLKAAMALVGFPTMAPRLPLDSAAPAVVEDLRGLLRHLESFTAQRLIGAMGRPS